MRWLPCHITTQDPREADMAERVLLDRGYASAVGADEVRGKHYVRSVTPAGRHRVDWWEPDYDARAEREIRREGAR